MTIEMMGDHFTDKEARLFCGEFGRNGELTINVYGADCGHTRTADSPKGRY